MVVDLVMVCYFRELYEIFRKYDDGNSRIPMCQLRKAFNEVNLFPAKSQSKAIIYVMYMYSQGHFTFEFSFYTM